LTPGTSPAADKPYRRVLLKISGEVFGGPGVNLDFQQIDRIASEIHETRISGIQIAVVVGGGNFLRGAEVAAMGMNRATADQAGMLATVMNGLALGDAIEKMGSETRMCSAITMIAVTEPFIRRRAIRHMEKGRIPILVGGTGNPYFTTDTTAALRAKEIEADIVLKATKVDGVYTADPKKDPTAKRLTRLTYSDVVRERYKVMDLTAITLCQETATPIVVFDLTVPGNVLRAARGEPIGTVITQ
jgi:uridylate kinase